MAHLKTKATTSNLSEREQWKWRIIRGLYDKGFSRLAIVNLFKFIDNMMTLPPQLQQSFKTKLTNFEEERKMPLINSFERDGIEQGLKQGTRNTLHKNIISLLSKRFSNVPNNLVEQINKIENISILERLILETITVNSVEEFESLINS